MSDVRRAGAAFFLALLIVALAGAGCSSGGSDDPGDLTGDFAPDASPAPAGSVSLQHGSSAADVVTVDVDVTDTNGVFGVAFDLVFDPDAATFLSAEEGDLLDGDGADTLFLVSEDTGRVVVGATRVQDGASSIPDVDATGSQRLASFRFRLRAAGTSRIDFDDERPRSVSDRDGVEHAVIWGGGALVAR